MGRSKRFTDAAAILAGLAVIVISFIPGIVPAALPDHIGIDKMGHIACYGVIGFLALYRRRSLWSSLMTAGTILYLGGVIELIQSDFNRTADLGDFAANGLGLALAGVAVTALRTLRRARRKSARAAARNGS